ncbi:hypothetical protein ACSRUE_36955 [Sorangium sp. KYC3313]|uniref:hypothetical protein n=1 Tax=Sorangium sp. KYC3313 TaxID=3449740 RepID=UPI003F8BA0BF
MTSLYGRAALAAAALLTNGALLLNCAGTLDEDEFPLDDQGSGGTDDQGAGGGTAAVTGSGGATTGGGSSGCAEAPALVAMKCATAGCHDENTKLAGLSLAAGWENTLQGQASVCGNGSSVLVPGDPDASAIYTKVTPDPPCNDRMPFGGAALSDTEIACIRDFIAALPP